MNLDDPKLTAYALNELTDPVDIAEIESWLAEHEEGRAFISETREIAAFLSEKMQTPSQISLTEEQRAVILDIPIVQFPSQRRNWSIIGLTALAACLAIGPLLPWTELLRLQNSSAPTMAVNDKPMTLQMPADDESLVAYQTAEPKTEGLSRAKDQIIVSESKLTLGDKATSYDRPSVNGPAEALASNPPSMAVPRQREESELMEKLKAGTLKQDSLLAVTGDLKSTAPSASLNLQLATSSASVSVGGGGGGSSSGAFYGVAASSGEKVTRRLNARAQGGSFDQDGYSDSSLQRRDDTKARSWENNTESYDSITENDFLSARENPLSTFSIDVDTASYANIRRFINNGQLPPKGAIRIEEMLNYFKYDYAQPEGDAPFSTNLEVADCPWQPEHRLVRIGLRGKEIAVAERKPANLVFLIDVSGSMNEPTKLPLLKQSLRLLVDQLGENDQVALTVYAGSSGLVLPSTTNKDAIRNALENLQPSGSTNGASGIKLAYEQATAHFIQDSVNRVILATDGDFNVGVTNQSDLVDLITEKAKTGVFLSVLGFGTGNLKDSTMEKLADKGNGNYAYIDTLREGKKVLVEQMGGTLVTIAKDVKIQVEFNPALVSNYRLIGYENRALKKEDFSDDKKDAGEIGAGHTVTALYEVVPVGSLSPEVHAEPLKYASNALQKVAILPSGEMLTVKLRYKEPSGDVSKKLEFPLVDKNEKITAASADFQFASAVAEVGQLLRNSEHKQLASWESALSRAEESKGEDPNGHRKEFVELMRRAQELTNKKG